MRQWRPLYVVVPVLLIIASSFLPVHAAPSWAREGNWAKYETTLTMEGQALQLLFGTNKLTVKEIVELRIVSVNSTGFKVLARVVAYHVEPKELEKRMENATLKTKTLYIRFDNKPGSQPLFYADPKQLPSNGVVRAGVEEAPVTATYDTRTGWLLEAYANTTKQGVTTTLHILLLDSNFIKTSSQQAAAGAEKKASTALYLSIAGVAATIAIIAILLARRRH